MLVTERAFYKIVQDTWTSTLGFQVDRAASAEFSPIGALTVCVKIAGAWDGEVRLHCSPPWLDPSRPPFSRWKPITQEATRSWTL